MRKNQMTYIGLLIGCTILASLRGGVITYALFYLCLGIPVVAIGYIFYVYMCLQFYQHTPSKIVKKGEILPYEVVFRNPGWIPFTHVKVNFYDEQCKVEESNKVKEYYLLPGDEKKLHTTLKCFYRGEYSVGVKEIEIMDFLGLFKITFSVMWFLELTVLPKVIELKGLSILPTYEDPKSLYSFNVEDMLLESDTRKYQPGDNLKQIHWKAVAKQGELLTRRVATEVKRENIIIMEQYAAEGTVYQKLALEDKVLEIVLAISFYLQSAQIGTKVIYEENGLKSYSIQNEVDFGNFYHTSSGLHFNSCIAVENILETYIKTDSKLNFYIVVTYHMTEKLYESVQNAIANNQQLVILYVQHPMNKVEDGLLNKLRMISNQVYCITPEDSLEEIIGR